MIILVKLLESAYLMRNHRKYIMIKNTAINDNILLNALINNNLLHLLIFYKSCKIFSWQLEKSKRAIALLPDTL